MAPKFPSINLSDYPQSTTIHGVKYLANRSRPLPDRIFWIFIFVVSFSSLGYFVSRIVRTWMDNPVLITNQNRPTHVFEIPFPAVTICPQIKIKKNKFDFTTLNTDVKQIENFSHFMSNDLGKKFTMAMQICRRAFQTYIYEKIKDSKAMVNAPDLVRMPKDWINTLHDISPTFDEVFEKCEMTSWKEDKRDLKVLSKKNCQRLFSTVVTNEGVCFTFNGIRDILREDAMHADFRYHNFTREQDGWDPEKGYTKAIAYPYKGIVKGAPLQSGGLKFVVTANRSDITPFCFPPNIGYKLHLHSPSAYPQTYENFIPLEFGKEYKIAVIPKTIKTNDNLRTFEPNVRNCYFNDERKLRFYTFYNEQNCRLECYANYSASIFDSVPFSSPRDSNTTNNILPHKNFGWDYPEFLGLQHEHFKVYGIPENLSDADSEVDCNCLPECNAIHYDYQIMKSNDEFLLSVVDETTETNLNVIRTTFEIEFNEPSFIGQKRVRLYTIETMISDFGGLLGLFMGGSILSLFELFYFLTIRNCLMPNAQEGQID